MKGRPKDRPFRWWLQVQHANKAEKKDTATAPKPHRITIVLGVLSPALAGLAFWVSLQSLNTSQQAMKVGQRAYLTITDSKLRHQLVKDYVPGDPSLSLYLQLTFDVHNLGNTPADLQNATPTVTDPYIATESKDALKNCDSEVITMGGFGAIGPKETRHYLVYFWCQDLSPQRADKYVKLKRLFEKKYREQGFDSDAVGPWVLLKLQYLDVFSDIHSAKWQNVQMASEISPEDLKAAMQLFPSQYPAETLPKTKKPFLLPINK